MFGSSQTTKSLYKMSPTFAHIVIRLLAAVARSGFGLLRWHPWRTLRSDAESECRWRVAAVPHPETPAAGERTGQTGGIGGRSVNEGARRGVGAPAGNGEPCVTKRTTGALLIWRLSDVRLAQAVTARSATCAGGCGFRPPARPHRRRARLLHLEEQSSAAEDRGSVTHPAAEATRR